jgi:chloramphenicol 3-O-phosphotransferase/RimJ/RimL family protein N-acetyltransferase
MPATVIFLNGTSSSGKTSIARAFQKLHAAPCLYASVDAFIFMFADHVRADDHVRPRVLPPVLSAFHRSLALLADSGFPVIVDHVLERRGWAEECAEALRGHRAFLVGVHCPLEILEQRERARGDRQIGFARWQADRVHTHGDYDFEIDSSRGSPEDAALRLLQLIESDAEPRAFARLRAPKPSAFRTSGAFDAGHVHVRPAAAADEPALLRLRHALWPDCPPERHALELAQFRASPGVTMVAEASDGEPVGFVEISIRHDHVEGTTATPVPYAEGWYVAEAWHGRGVGKALMASVERWALTQGFRELASDAELDNHNSIAAHAALGFREVGRGVHFVKRLA